MIPVFRAAPRRCANFTLLPSRSLSPHSTPFLMRSSNPSESYHAALPCSLNKSSFFHPLDPLLSPFIPPCLLFPLSSCISSAASPRRLSRRLFSLYLLRPNSPICIYLIWLYSITIYNAFILLLASTSPLSHFDFILTLLLILLPAWMRGHGKKEFIVSHNAFLSQGFFVFVLRWRAEKTYAPFITAKYNCYIMSSTSWEFISRRNVGVAQLFTRITGKRRATFFFQRRLTSIVAYPWAQTLDVEPIYHCADKIR